MKQSLLEKTGMFLLKDGFIVKSLTRTCFDILARKADMILLIKVLEDANSVTKEHTIEMLKLADYIKAAPIIIAEKANEKLQDYIVYTRFDVFTLNFTTFTDCVHHRMPFIKRKKAGLTASIIGKKLREAREKHGYSLNTLAQKLGVSSRMISKYEEGKSEITIAKAMKLYDVFGGSVFDKVNVLKAKHILFPEKKTDVTKKFSSLGFQAIDTKKLPFDVIAKKDTEIILTEVGDKDPKQMHSLSRLLDADNLVIFKKKKPKDIPAMTKKEFLEFEKARELIKFLKEFE